MLPSDVPYRIDLTDAPADALDRLIDLGALDVDAVGHGLAALLPDDVSLARVAAALGLDDVRATKALGRDEDSVWILRQRPLRIGRLQLLPEDAPAVTDGIRLVDSVAFGTGLHATTALCLEALEEEIDAAPPTGLLDVGTGSGVLALAALHAGVDRAVALDIDPQAVRTTRENARLNGLTSRLQVVRGDLDAVSTTWPLVVANILSAPLIEMAPTLGRRVGHRGRVILSGIRSSLTPEVEQAYRRAGMRHVFTRTRDGWDAITLQASW